MEKFHTPKDAMLGMLAEVGELSEHFKWRQGKELDTLRHTRKRLGKSYVTFYFGYYI